MKKNFRWLVLGVAFIGMGAGMPSCPGQKAMQQEMDSVQAANQDLTKKVQALSAQVTGLNNDMAQVKQLLPQMTQLIKAQKDQLDLVDAAVKDMQSKTMKGPNKGSNMKGFNKKKK